MLTSVYWLFGVALIFLILGLLQFVRKMLGTPASYQLTSEAGQTHRIDAYGRDASERLAEFLNAIVGETMGKPNSAN